MCARYRTREFVSRLSCPELHAQETILWLPFRVCGPMTFNIVNTLPMYRCRRLNDGSPSHSLRTSHQALMSFIPQHQRQCQCAHLAKPHFDPGVVCPSSSSYLICTVVSFLIPFSTSLLSLLFFVATFVMLLSPPCTGRIFSSEVEWS